MFLFSVISFINCKDQVNKIELVVNLFNDFLQTQVAIMSFCHKLINRRH